MQWKLSLHQMINIEKTEILSESGTPPKKATSSLNNLKTASTSFMNLRSAIDYTQVPGFWVELPLSKLPKSSIVQNKQYNIYKQCSLFITKYILTDAPLSINISYETLNNIKVNFHDALIKFNKQDQISNEDNTMKYDDDELTELSQIFDDALGEVRQLLNQCYFRYKSLFEQGMNFVYYNIIYVNYISPNIYTGKRNDKVTIAMEEIDKEKKTIP